MKLYTEEQAKYFFECGRNFQMNGEVTFNIAQDEVTPIELPSDEEIYKEAKNNENKFRGWGEYETSAFIIGAKWMRDKIQVGEK